jgi:hypothetical protein
MPARKEFMKSKKMNNAFEHFTKLMRSRLNEKEKIGWSGWDDNVEVLDRELISRAVDNLLQPGTTNMADAANFAMFLYYRRSHV